jgi:hypothetical protein
MTVGIVAVAGAWPSALAVGTGASAGLLGQNLVGLGLCVLAYGLGVLIERVRAPRSTEAYFENGAGKAEVS